MAKIGLDTINIDPSIQMRVRTSERVVRRYVEGLDQLPEITVFQVENQMTFSLES
ncbi:MAG: hypothetical protein ACLQAT_13865 [Candidatus Binataceae bacterium]